MKKLLLSLLFITSSVSASWTNALYQALFVQSLARNVECYINVQTKLDTHYKKIEHEKMLAFAKKECQEVAADKEIHFYVGDGHHFGMNNGNLAIARGDNAIIIMPDYYALLEQVFNKEVLTQQDEGTLDIFRFILQHEVGHLINNDQRSGVICYLSVTIAKMLLFELSKESFNFTGSRLASFLTLNLIGTYIQSKLLWKEQEYRADRGIKTKAAVAGGKQFCKNLITLKKSNEQQYWMELLNWTHPTSEDRLKRLEARAC